MTANQMFGVAPVRSRSSTAYSAATGPYDIRPAPLNAGQLHVIAKREPKRIRKLQEKAPCTIHDFSGMNATVEQAVACIEHQRTGDLLG